MNETQNMNRKSSKTFILISIILFIFFFISNVNYAIQNNKFNSIIEKQNDFNNNDFIPEKSQTWDGILNLTNHNEIDGKTFTHGLNITIKGLVYYPLPYSPLKNINVSVVIDNVLYPLFSNKTDVNGEFQIEYTINYSLNIYSSHRIEVNVTDNLEIYYNHYYIVNANATSYFDIDNHNLNNPQLARGYYYIPGFLNYDNHSGIPDQIIKSTWKNKTHDLQTNSPFKTNSYGSFKYITIPDDSVSKILFLNLTYNGNSTYINGSQELISVRLYRNITCVWRTGFFAEEGDTMTIRGQLFARNNLNLVINFTDVRITRNGATIAIKTTDSNGNFNHSFTFPIGSAGNNIFGLELANFSNIFSNILQLIIIVASDTVFPAEDIGDDDEDTPPPFQNFFIGFIPIIIGFAAVLIVFIYNHLRKQKAESFVVKLPLEDRIRNLKILKDTERLEEALSYLFQSIYLELINAKYGRRMKESETIRDIAIISVREFNLKPAHIYPFIQNIEKIIYDKPFLIEEKDFYDLVELFSPIYYEFTGYHFVLNF